MSTRKNQCSLSVLESSRFRSLLLFLFLLGFGILYASTPAKNHSEAEDSIHYLIITRDGSLTALFHPHHLLFHVLNRGVYLLWLLLGLNGSPEIPMAMTNIVAGLAGLVLVYALARRIGMSFYLSLVCMAAVAGSYGYWWYSVEAETYLPPIPFLLLSAYLFVAIAESRFESRRFVGLGLALAAGTLLHQQHIVLVLVTTLSIFIVWRLLRPDVAASTFIKGVVILSVTSCVSIIVPYLLAATMVHGRRDLGGIIDWTRSYHKAGLYAPWALSNPIKSLIGIGRSIWGLGFAFKFSWFQEFVTRTFPHQLMVEELFLVNRMASLTTWLAVFTFGLGVLCAIVLVARLIFRRQKHARASLKPIAKFAFIALVIPLLIAYSVFNILWEPQNIEFWIALVPFLFLVLTAWIVRPQWDRSGRVLAWTFVASVAICNLAGSVLPQTNLDGDFWYEANRYLIENTQAGDLVVVEGGFRSEGYLGFYGKATVLPAAGVDPDVLLSRIQEHKSGRVLISSRVFDPLPQIADALSRKHKALPDKGLLEKLADRLQVVDTNFYQTIWIYQDEKSP